MEDDEPAFQKHLERSDPVLLEHRENVVGQKLGDLSAAGTRANTERIEKEALYNQLRAIEKDGAALEAFPAILTNTFIQQQKAEPNLARRRLPAI